MSARASAHRVRRATTPRRERGDIIMRRFEIVLAAGLPFAACRAEPWGPEDDEWRFGQAQCEGDFAGCADLGTGGSSSGGEDSSSSGLTLGDSTGTDDGGSASATAEGSS